MDKLSVDNLLGIKSLKKSDINLIFKTAIPVSYTHLRAHEPG